MRQTSVALRPLFDRLTDESPEVHHESPIKRNLDTKELRLSIQNEIERILTTRYVQRNWADPDRPDAYGIPDLLAFDPSSLQGWPDIEESLLSAIQRYEPRLKEPYVILQSYEARQQAVHVSIGGTLPNGDMIEPITFPIAIQVSYQAS